MNVVSLACFMVWLWMARLGLRWAAHLSVYVCLERAQLFVYSWFCAHKRPSRLRARPAPRARVSSIGLDEFAKVFRLIGYVVVSALKVSYLVCCAAVVEQS